MKPFIVAAALLLGTVALLNCSTNAALADGNARKGRAPPTITSPGPPGPPIPETRPLVAADVKCNGCATETTGETGALPTRNGARPLVVLDASGK